MNKYAKRESADLESKRKIYDDYWKSLERKPEEKEIQGYVTKIKELARRVEEIGGRGISSLEEEIQIRSEMIEILGEFVGLRDTIRERTGKKIEENKLFVDNKYVVGDFEIRKASAFHLEDPKRYKDAALLILEKVPDNMKHLYLSPNLSSIENLSNKGNSIANKLLEEFAKSGIEVGETIYYKFRRLPKEQEK